MPVNLIWVWTPLFSQGIRLAGSRWPGDGTILQPDMTQPKETLSALRRALEGDRGAVVAVCDVARFPDQTLWAYVADGINKSGANPLRGLGPALKEPFMDVSRLYQVPRGETGVVAVSLGDRYPRRADGPGIICSHLQTVALLAHATGMAVTGVLVSEAHLPDFSPELAFGDVHQVMAR